MAETSATYARWQQRLEQAIRYVYERELEKLARTPARDRDRVAMRLAVKLARSGRRIPGLSRF